MQQLFLLEDDAPLARGIAMALAADDRTIATASSLAEARPLLSGRRYDLLILDVNLPDGSGLDLLRQLRESGDATPVMLLTANDLEMDEVLGLEAGANDYITKPFSLAVLRARVAVQLRTGRSQAQTRCVIGPFVFDFEAMDFRREGEAVQLSKTEQRLLRVLVDNQGHAVSRETLSARIWGDGERYVDENALSVAVGRLRQKLERDAAHPIYLRTVYGIGYLWAVVE
ncbi:MAG: response regulator transcription factor [Peptococcaceae bacterium]|nr:response regulator transcription factor [Peptococcaceae bacterium]